MFPRFDMSFFVSPGPPFAIDDAKIRLNYAVHFSAFLDARLLGWL
jgi:hypothetical protein